MNAKAKDAIKNVAVLCVIALVSGLLLGLVNHFTAVDPKAEAVARFQKLLPKEGGYTLVAENEGDVLFVAESGDTVALLSKGKGGFKGEVQTFVFFEKGKIVLVAAGENGETYMHKLSEKGYYQAFYGWDGSKPLQVDAVTGATRSSTAVKNAVTAAADYYNLHYGEGANG